MSKDKNREAPKAPTKKVSIDPSQTRKETGELDDEQLDKVAGGLMSKTTKAGTCTCSNMPSDPTT